MNTLLTQMGNRIYTRRKQLHLTQDALAERANVTPQMISSAELGKKALRPENIIKICSALDISTNYLLTGNVTDKDYSSLIQKIETLTPTQYRCLEEIIHSFLNALYEENVN